MSLGWDHIDAIVVELDEVDREIWEIDENLQRAGLSKAEEREHFKRRKELWAKRAKSVVAHDAPKLRPAAAPKASPPRLPPRPGAPSLRSTGTSPSLSRPSSVPPRSPRRRAPRSGWTMCSTIGADGDDLAIPSFLTGRQQRAGAERNSSGASKPQAAKLETQHIGVIKARRLHIDEAVNVGVDVETEIELFADELRLAARKRAGNGAADIDAKERRTA